MGEERNGKPGGQPGNADTDLLPQLQAERDSLDPSFMHSSKLLDKEIARVKTGRPADDNKFLEAHTMKPTKVSIKVVLPVREFPKFNFVGKLLGPGGTTMKKLQMDTQCRMAIMGRGSMKDKRKEEDLRKEGDPKNAHLNDDLHLRIETLAPVADAYGRVAHALKEIQPYLIPERDDGPPHHGPPPGHDPRGMNPYENGGRMDTGPPPRAAPAPPFPGEERRPYRDDPYYDAPPSQPAPPPRGYDDYRAPPSRDPYDRPPARDSRDPYGPPPSSAPPPSSRGPPPPREGYYDYGHSSAPPPAPRDRYEDYDARGSSSWQQPSSAPYKSAPPPRGSSAPRGRAPPERTHPYSSSGGRGAPPRY